MIWQILVDYLLYPEQPDARIRNIEALLRDKPESFIIAVERLVRLCIEECAYRLNAAGHKMQRQLLPGA